MSTITDAIRALPEYPEEMVPKLFVDRGSPGSHMTTLALEAVVRKENYLFNGRELRATVLPAIDLEAAVPEKVVKPPHLKVEALWDETVTAIGATNNALGDNGRLELPVDLLEIPTVEATDETLAWYGAKLIKPGDVVRFPDLFPLFHMTVGKKYVPEFIMTEEGDGMYLEYHHDQPHYHLSVKGEGYYLLARWNKDHTKLSMTGFHIPDGTAVYTKKGAIHCDAGLSGEFVMGYTFSHDFSTVLWRHGETKVGIKFLEEEKA